MSLLFSGRNRKLTSTVNYHTVLGTFWTLVTTQGNIRLRSASITGGVEKLFVFLTRFGMTNPLERNGAVFARGGVCEKELIWGYSRHLQDAKLKRGTSVPSRIKPRRPIPRHSNAFSDTDALDIVRKGLVKKPNALKSESLAVYQREHKFHKKYARGAGQNSSHNQAREVTTNRRELDRYKAEYTSNQLRLPNPSGTQRDGRTSSCCDSVSFVCSSESTATTTRSLPPPSPEQVKRSCAGEKGRPIPGPVRRLDVQQWVCSVTAATIR